MIIVIIIVVVVTVVVFIIMGHGCVDVVDVDESVVTMDTQNSPQPHDLLRVGLNDLEKKILSGSKPPSTNQVVCG